MADKKISALTGATTPLAGTEVLPIVQGGNTVKVSVDNLTTGKTVTANGLVLTGAATINNSTAIRWKNGSGTARDVIQLYGNDLYVDSEDGDQIYRVGGYEKYRLSSANATLTNVNLVVGTAGKGIDFSANTHAAGMTSELLDWYEEGTWTPTMTSASGTTTVNSSSARYTRIGDKVFVVFQINYSTDASVSTSDFTIGGLPFTSLSTFNSRGFVSNSNWTGSDFSDGYIIIGPSVTSLLWTGRAVNQSSRTNAILSFCADYFVA